MDNVEELNGVSSNSSEDDCENEEENSDHNVCYSSSSCEDSYVDKLQESSSDCVSISSESEFEPTSFDDIQEIMEEPEACSFLNFTDQEEYLCNKLLTCGCIFLAIFTPIVINCAMTESSDMIFDDDVKVAIVTFLGLDTDTHLEYDLRSSKEVLDATDNMYTPTFFDLKEIKQNEKIINISDEECVQKVAELDLPKNDREKIRHNNRRAKNAKFEKIQKKGDKSNKLDSINPHTKRKYEKPKGEFPQKYKEKHADRKPERSCSREITKLKSLLDNKEAKLRKLSRLLSDKDRDIKLLELRILQDVRDLKQIKKTYDGNKFNDSLSGEWYDNYFHERGKVRKRQQASSWLFDRADFRNRKRNRESKRRKNWYVDWMSHREAERTKRGY